MHADHLGHKRSCEMAYYRASIEVSRREKASGAFGYSGFLNRECLAILDQVINDADHGRVLLADSGGGCTQVGTMGRTCRRSVIQSCDILHASDNCGQRSYRVGLHANEDRASSSARSGYAINADELTNSHRLQNRCRL
jgi:hypothetical protein